MDIPEIVKEYVLKNCKRMPETQQEIDEYLDLINYSKRYIQSLELSSVLSQKMMKRFGFKTPQEVKKEMLNYFNPITQ